METREVWRGSQGGRWSPLDVLQAGNSERAAPTRGTQGTWGTSSRPGQHLMASDSGRHPHQGGNGQPQDQGPCTLRICSWHACGYKPPPNLHRNAVKSPRGTRRTSGQLARAPALHGAPHEHSAKTQLPLLEKPCPCPPGAFGAKREKDRTRSHALRPSGSPAEAQWRLSRGPAEAPPDQGPG